jgi:predicted GNAT family N-acyltransferase
MSKVCIIFDQHIAKSTMATIEVKSALFSDKETCNQIFKIRQEVFVDEQKVDREEEFDSYESSSLHYLGLMDGKPAGTARWRITEKGIKLERFAVLKSFRKNGVAAAVLSKVLADVIPSGHRIYLNAQVSAMGFYEKNGFKKEGPMFVEANIDHFVMNYSL